MKDDRTCKSCKYFKLVKNVFTYVRFCDHPAITTDDPFTFAMLDMKEDDYCSRYEPREE